MSRLLDRFKAEPWLVMALVFAIVQLVITAVLVEHQNSWVLLYWYCDHVSFLYAIAFWRKRLALAAGFMYVGIVAQITWIIDFFGHLLGYNIFNLTNYMFVGDLNWLKVSAVLAHTVVPVLMAAWAVKRQPVGRSIMYAFDYIVVLFATTLLFTPASQNVNCVFSPCSSVIPSWNYMLLWPVYLFTLVLLTYALHKKIFALRERSTARVTVSPSLRLRTRGI